VILLFNIAGKIHRRGNRENYMKNLLKQYFGYDSFRPFQEKVINNVMAKNDTVVIMPTGGGKSLCYQLPALKLGGLTLVISPLISLMKDQVDGLKANGIGAEHLNSSLKYQEIVQIQNKAKIGKIKILYLAPERLALESFKNFLRTLNISLVAIDEAHCISEWGHDFRPDYRNLKIFKEQFPQVPIIALTATATPKVRMDIVRQLLLNRPKMYISSFDRKNLNLHIYEKANAYRELIRLLEKHKNESAIIYCFSRKETEELAEDLNRAGFKVLAYHAGLEPNVRRQNQELFIKDEIRIMTATIAFGMGIDKPDVRLVVHWVFPKTLEGYYQEIGRAGRDGLSSECVTFYSYGDLRKHEYFINQLEDVNERELARQKVNQVVEYCEQAGCRRKRLLGYFGEEYKKDNCGACDACLDAGQSDYHSPAAIKRRYFYRNREDLAQFQPEYDFSLFEKLRALRKQLADINKVPPFIIFSDVALREMVYYLPVDKEHFSRIQGASVIKLENFGGEFLKVILKHVRENNLFSLEVPFWRGQRAKNKTSRYQKTKEMMVKKLSLAEIAKEQKLTVGTIINHLDRLLAAGEDLNIFYLKPRQEDFEKIRSAFLACGAEKLRPVYDYLQEKYSYDEIRLVKLLINLERQEIKK